jgi:hypothetical protein
LDLKVSLINVDTLKTMNAPDVYQRYFKYISIEEANKTRTSPTNTLFKKVHDSNIWSIEAVDH